MTKKMSRLKRGLFSAAVLLLVVSGIALYQYQKFQIDLLLKDMPLLHKRHSHLVSETAYFQAEVDRLSNINRVAAIAKKEFGLVFDDQPRLTLKFDEKRERLQAIRKKFAEQSKPARPQNMQSAGVP